MQYGFDEDHWIIEWSLVFIDYCLLMIQYKIDDVIWILGWWTKIHVIDYKVFIWY